MSPERSITYDPERSESGRASHHVNTPIFFASLTASIVYSEKMTRWALLLAAALMCGRAQDKSPEYVGSEACKTFHADVWAKFFRNPHYKSVVSGKEPPAHTGCEGCHGPGSAHVAAGGGKGTIRAFSVM